MSERKILDKSGVKDVSSLAKAEITKYSDLFSERFGRPESAGIRDITKELRH